VSVNCNVQREVRQSPGQRPRAGCVLARAVRGRIGSLSPLIILLTMTPAVSWQWSILPPELNEEIWSHIGPPRPTPQYEYQRLQGAQLYYPWGDHERIRIRELQKVSLGFAQAARARWIANVHLTGVKQMRALLNQLEEEEGGQAALPVALHVRSLHISADGKRDEVETFAHTVSTVSLSAMLILTEDQACSLLTRLPHLKVLSVDPSFSSYSNHYAVMRALDIATRTSVHTVFTRLDTSRTTPPLNSEPLALALALPPAVTCLSIDLGTGMDQIMLSKHVTTLGVHVYKLTPSLVTLLGSLPSLRVLSLRVDHMFPPKETVHIVQKMLQPTFAELRELHLREDFGVNTPAWALDMLYLVQHLPLPKLIVLHVTFGPMSQGHMCMNTLVIIASIRTWPSLERLVFEVPIDRDYLLPIETLLSTGSMPQLRVFAVWAVGSCVYREPADHEIKSCTNRGIRLQWGRLDRHDILHVREW
jgi:hypothetical protein